MVISDPQHIVLKSHTSNMGVKYLQSCNDESNMPSWLSQQWYIYIYPIQYIFIYIYIIYIFASISPFYTQLLLIVS